MGMAIGDILPLALGVAISPIPIMAAILMLLSPKARSNGVGFLVGWILGIIVVVTVFTLVASAIPASDPNAGQPVKGTIQLVVGVLLLLLAVGQWRKRPRKGEEVALPRWMRAIDDVRFPAAFGFGFLLSAVNPKNLIMSAGAGTAIATADLPPSGEIVVIAIFTVVAASTIAIPVIGYLFAADNLRAPLASLREWLGKENSIIMAVLLLVIGISMIGKGIGSF